MDTQHVQDKFADKWLIFFILIVRDPNNGGSNGVCSVADSSGVSRYNRICPVVFYQPELYLDFC